MTSSGNDLCSLALASILGFAIYFFFFRETSASPKQRQQPPQPKTAAQQSEQSDRTASGQQEPSLCSEESSLPAWNEVNRDCIQCDYCHAPGPTMRCSRCWCAYYCGRDCQRRHWRENHREECLSIDVIKTKMEGWGMEEAKGEDALNTECVICLTDTIQDPVILECRHAFCKQCFKDYRAAMQTATKTSDADDDDDETPTLVCPMCRAPSDNISNKRDIELSKIGILVARSQRHDLSVEEKSKILDKALKDVKRLLDSKPIDLQLLNMKATVLLFLDHDNDKTRQAVETLDEVLVLNAKAERTRAQFNSFMEDGKRAFDKGQQKKAWRFLNKCNAIKLQCDQGTCSIHPLPTETFIEVKLDKARAHQKLKQWEEAHDVYRELYGMRDLVAQSTSTYHKFTGDASCCFYKTGDYAKAIATGKLALAVDRHFAGAHKYVALSYLKQGDADKAKQLLNQAFLYEEPWDEKHRAEVYQLWQQVEAGTFVDE